MRAKALERVGLLTVTLLASSACAVKTVDCWQLNDQEIADARQHGQCGDAFARNHDEFVPIGSVVPPQRRKARPPSVQLADDPTPVAVPADTPKKRKANQRPTPTQSAQNFP